MEKRLLRIAAEALRRALAPRARILEAASPGANRIDMLLERGGGEPDRIRLVVDLAPSRPCIYLARPRETVAAEFALGRHLAGRWIVGVEPSEDSPVLRILLGAAGVAGVSASLILEWLGGRPDAILVDAADDRIVATLNEPSGAHARRRARGAVYADPPAPHRPAYDTATEAQVASILGQARGASAVRTLCKSFRGLPDYIAFEAVRLRGSAADHLRALAAAPADPALYEIPGTGASIVGSNGPDGPRPDELPAAFVSPIPLETLRPFLTLQGGSIFRLMERANAAALRSEAAATAASAIGQIVDRESRRLARLRARLEEEDEEADLADEFRRQAEALLVRIQDVPRGASRFTCPDPADPSAEITINLDPRLGAAANAKALFRKARRLARGGPIRKRRMREIDQAIARLSVLRSQIGTDPAPILSGAERLLREALGPFARSARPARPGSDADPGLIRKKRREPRDEERFHPREYKTREGWTVLVGRSNEENDYLTHRLARPDDYWFHAHGCPGSHVVLRRENRKSNPSRGTIEEAASIAAYFSKARTSRKVPVLYTLKKHVRKPRGAPAGLASVSHEKTVMAVPKEPPASGAGEWDSQ